MKKQVQVPKDIFEQCPGCNRILLKKELQENFKVCTKCGHIFRMNCLERIEMLCDKDSFKEFLKNYTSKNILNFTEYDQKLEEARKKTKINEACICGFCSINGIKSVICVLDFNFMGGSMGSVVGEKVTTSFEKAKLSKLPIVIVSASGGARMQEGIVSLMQMAKTSAACAIFKKTGLPYISVLTDPTTGGVTASFAMLGDIIIAENKSLIGFAGPRVIEQTIKQKLPEGFQSAEFLLEHGFVDIVVQRKELKKTIYNILKLCINNLQNCKTRKIKK